MGRFIGYILTITLMLFLMGDNFVLDGMFRDGILNATVSHNLANGLSNFWHPKFTETVFSKFQEHPPLFYGIQSLFFKVLGSAWWVEHLYSFVVLLISIGLIIYLWHLIAPSSSFRHLAFLPLLFWVSNESVQWAYPNNMLECTVSLFLLIAILFLFRQYHRTTTPERVYWPLTLAGVLIFLGLFTKGPVALFPLAFPFLSWLLFRKPVLKRQAFFDFLILIGVVAVCLGLLLLIPDARENLKAYFDIQVMASLNGERTENIAPYRFKIVVDLLEKNAIALLLTAFFLARRFRREKPDTQDPVFRMGIFFICIALSGSLPIMLSMKQAAYYFVPAMPYMALGLALLAAPEIEYITKRLKLKAYNSIGLLLSSFLLLAALGYSLSHIGEIDKRDRMILKGVYATGPVVPSGTTIGCQGEVEKFSPLHSFYMRHFFISLDTLHPYDHEFLITMPESPSPPSNYQLVPTKSPGLQLFKYDANLTVAKPLSE